MSLPKMMLYRQTFPRETLAAPAETLTSLISASWIPEKVRPGQTVAAGGARPVRRRDSPRAASRRRLGV